MSITYCGTQPRPGTYALLLSSATDAVIRVGQLGSLRLRSGYYVYIGSALGSGGVCGRLAHYMRPAAAIRSAMTLRSFDFDSALMMPRTSSS